MNEPKQKSLLELYQLLWEQIKDVKMLKSGLCRECRSLVRMGIVSDEEKNVLIFHIYSKFPDLLRWKHAFPLTEKGTADRKAFVQRMIKELENDK